MNYMKQVADMLGVELGEEFDALYTETNVKARCKLIDDFLLLYAERCWQPNVPWLQFLLNGSAVIEKLPFKPKQKERYWCLDTRGDAIERKFKNLSLTDNYNILHGNCYRTQAEAEKHKDEWVRFFKEAVQE